MHYNWTTKVFPLKTEPRISYSYTTDSNQCSFSGNRPLDMEYSQPMYKSVYTRQFSIVDIHKF